MSSSPLGCDFVTSLLLRNLGRCFTFQNPPPVETSHGTDESAILIRLRLQLHGAIYYRPYSFVFILRYCANLKAIRHESTSFNRIAANKSHRVIAA